jgi:flagellar biogenesis protein FliO
VRAAAVSCLLFGTPALLAGEAETSGVQPSVSHTAANSRTLEPAPDPAAAPVAASAARSAVEAEPIRRGGDSGSVTSPVSSTPSSDLPRVASALAVVIGLILLLRWGAKKLFNQGIQGRSSRAVQVLTRSAIAPRQHILLLRVGRRVLVVGSAGAQMNPLCEITDADEIAALLGQLQDEKIRLPSKAFGALFTRARQDIGGSEDEDIAATAENEETETSAFVPEETPQDPALATTRDEISGLMDKIRSLSKNIRGGAA